MSKEVVDATYAEIPVGDTRDRIWKIGTCRKGHLHVAFTHPSVPDVTVALVFQTPEDIYDLAEDLLAGYDELAPVAPATGRRRRR